MLRPRLVYRRRESGLKSYAAPIQHFFESSGCSSNWKIWQASPRAQHASLHVSTVAADASSVRFRYLDAARARSYGRQCARGRAGAWFVRSCGRMYGRLLTGILLAGKVDRKV